MKKDYKISIITVVKNSVSTIEKSIESVIKQNYNNIEYIIIDSNSDDGTSEVISNFKNKIKYIREKDESLWDAMNKGLKIASGDIVGFLNADDFYYENSLEIVNEYFNNKEIDFLFGGVKKYKLMSVFNPKIIKYSFGFYTSHSVGFFIKRKLHLKVGLYNKKYLSADLDFFYKMIVNFKLKGCGTSKNEILGEFSKGGFSSKINYLDHLKDLNQIRIDNNQGKIFVYFLFLIKILKKPLKFLKALLKK